MIHSILEQVVRISPNAASITKQNGTINGQHFPLGTFLLTSFASITTRDTRHHLLIVHQPLLQTANDASALLESRVLPGLLRLRGSLDLLFDFMFIVRKVGTKMKASRWVVRGDVSSVGYTHGREDFWVFNVTVQSWFLELSGLPCWVGSLFKRKRGQYQTEWRKLSPRTSGNTNSNGTGLLCLL